MMGVCYFFFFKQKTAYEMRISDWSSDVCSSDLTKCSLEDLDAAADGGLRQVQNIGSSPKAALFGDNDRILQIAKIKRKVWHCARDRPIKPGRQGAGSSRTIFDRALHWPPQMGAIRCCLANAPGAGVDFRARATREPKVTPVSPSLPAHRLVPQPPPQ